ncbi:MAG TPA: ABC transporter permease [Candidatus Limnocylindrales bacterium]|nr:ABC transporter permease [Candidatus Limnocylindrales bacterium]
MEQLLAFLTAASSWQAETGIPDRMLEHVIVAGLAVVVASALALPLGFYIGHTGRLQLLGINLANIGRAVPSYAVMVMLLPVMLGLAPVLGYDPRLGLRVLPIFLAMVLLAIPPILVGTYAGLRDIDPDITESARAMGLTERQILRRMELPLASPVIVGGFRIAVLQVIATATIGAYLAGGGLGRFIIDGIARQDDGMLYTGVLLVAVLAIGTDLLLSWLQRRLTPRGVSLARGGVPGGSTPEAA